MPGFSLPTLLRAVAVWLLIIAAESAQGAIRHVLASPQVEFAVRQVSVITGALVIFAITWFCARWMRIRTAAGALWIGLKHRIEQARERQAEVEADRIAVIVDGGRVRLTGKVRAGHERGVIEGAAWSAPSVQAVEDKLTVG